MLSDYRKYLLNLRNNLIRCGVELEATECYSYEDIFYLGEKLSGILWFYSVLEISGSEDRLKGFLLPLNSSYRSKLRDKYFEDYLLYRAGYMQISVSDALHRKEKEKNRNISTNSISNVIKEDKEEKTYVEASFVDDDGFLVYGSGDTINNLQENSTSSEPEDEEVFDNWGTDEEEDIVEDDEFIEYNSEDDESVFDSWSSDEEETVNFKDIPEDEDEFIDYDSDDKEDSFDSWSSDEEVIEDEDILEEESDFSSWGEEDSSDSWDSEEEESEEFQDEEEFSEWGNEEESYGEEDNNAFLDWGTDDEDTSEDSFDSWSSDEDDEEESSSDFDSWSPEEEEVEDDFSDWGSNEEESDDNFSDWDLEDEDDGDNFSSWGDVEVEDTHKAPENNDINNTINNRVNTRVSELEDVEKTVQTIENVTAKILSKGGLFKSKVLKKMKNMEDNSE